jgi:hypothetical protein
MLPLTAAEQSASVLQVQKRCGEAATVAQVLAELGQSLEPVQLATHLLSTGWQPEPRLQFASLVQTFPPQLLQN